MQNLTDKEFDAINWRNWITFGAILIRARSRICPERTIFLKENIESIEGRVREIGESSKKPIDRISRSNTSMHNHPVNHIATSSHATCPKDASGIVERKY